MTVTIAKNGNAVPAMSSWTARTIWDLAQHGPVTQCENIKTVDAWRAIRHQYKTHSTKALTIAAKAAQEHGMVYILHADDKVSRVMIDYSGKAKVSSAYPY